MNHLQQSGLLVFLDVPLPVLEARVGDVGARGLAREEGQTFAQLFGERQPLYLRYADIRIECAGKTLAEICAAILAVWRR
jgi:shikimate kinase